MTSVRRSVFASLLPLVVASCALTDDFAIAEAESTKDAARSPAGKGGASGKGDATGGTLAVASGGVGLPAAGGVGGASASGGTAAGKAGAGGAPADGKGGASACVPERELCDGISNDCDDEIDEGAACPAGCSVQTYDGHLYALCLFADESRWVTYEDAASACAALGNELDSGSEFALTWIESKPENNFLKTWIAETTPLSTEAMVWSGANDLDEERTWVWGQEATAEHFFDQAPEGGGKPYGSAFHDFPPGKPNSANDWDEDCGGFDSELDWRWNDFKCEDPRLGYVCEERR